jgi:hypothetical protein
MIKDGFVMLQNTLAKRNITVCVPWLITKAKLLENSLALAFM